MAKLVVLGNDGRKEIELGAVTTIGRHPDNMVQILDRIVSKEHAQVIRQPTGAYLYRDLNSLNGSFLRGERVNEHLLGEGDELTLGSTQLVFHDQSVSDAVLERVSIEPAPNETLIRQRLQAPPGSREFLPEKEISDIEVLRRDYEKLRLAHELGRSIGLEVDLDLLLAKILLKAFELIPADRGVILLMEADGVPKPRIARTRDGRNEQIVLSRSILNEVVSQKTAVLSADASMDSRFSGAHSIILQGIRSTMTVPLIHHDELLGVMHLDTHGHDRGLRVQGPAALRGHRRPGGGGHPQRAPGPQDRARGQDPGPVPAAALAQPRRAGGRRQPAARRRRRPPAGDRALLGHPGLHGHDREKPAQERSCDMLNEYFEVMVDVIFRHQGTLDKFVGDEIIALFGAPVDVPDAELQAVECALDMQKALKDFNRTRKAEGHEEEIRAGIGIDTGDVITGAIGSSRALQYTAIGDAMNLASRLCGAAKAEQILISEGTYKKVGERVAAVAMPPMRFKNKAEEQRVFNVIGLRGTHPFRHETIRTQS